MTYSNYITPTHLAPMCQIALRWTASQWLLQVLYEPPTITLFSLTKQSVMKVLPTACLA